MSPPSPLLHYHGHGLKRNIRYKKSSQCHSALSSVMLPHISIKLQAYLHSVPRPLLRMKMSCDYGYTSGTCGVNTTTSFLYPYPAFQTNNDNFESNCEKNSHPVCEPPEKLNGLPIELAVRKEPFKGYPKRSVLNKEPKIPQRERKPSFNLSKSSLDPDNVILQNIIKGPVWTSRFCLKRIHTLLVRDETAITLEDRIWALWTHYENTAKDVFIYDDVDIVANIILLLSTSFLRLPYSQNLFDKIMERLQRGIYLKSGLKDSVDTKKLAYFFTVTGLCIVEGHPWAQASISSIVGVWLESIIDKRQQSVDYRKLSAANLGCPLRSRLMKRSSQLTVMVPDNLLISALEKSLLPRIISEYFTYGSHTAGYISILSLLKFCCDASTVIRDRLLSLPVLDPILLKLSMPDPANRILLTSCDFIHSYFGINSEIHRNGPIKNLSKSNPIVPILEKDSFQILLTRLIQQLGHCASKSLLNTRNDTAFLICLIGERVPEVGLYYEGFGLLFASIISSAILGMKEVDMAYLIDSTPEDLELLQYLIYMIKSVVENGCGEDLIKEYNTVAVLLRLIFGPCQLTTTPSGDSVAVGGDGKKGNDLENAAWATIQAIAKRCPLSMLTPHGVPSLLTFLKAYGEIGKGHQRILAMCMHTIRVLLTTPEEDACISDEVMGYFIQRDGMAIFVGVLEQLIKGNFDELQETVVSNCLYCCAALANYDYEQKEQFIILEGVSILLRMLRYLICPSADKRHMNPVIQMAFAECFGCCVAYSPRGLEKFLAMEGVFRLLDLLEISASPEASIHLLHSIIQLCDYPRCVDQLLYWHRPMNSSSKRVVFGEELDDLAKLSWKHALDDGPKPGDVLEEIRQSSDQSLYAMLCSLWKEEEDRFDVLRDPEGCIASITQPLMSKFARTYDQASEEKRVRRSYLDLLSLSLRPKIFLLVKRIVETTKTEAILFDGLSLSNQVVMQVIINFVDLKKSEIYLEMVEEREREGPSNIAPEDDENFIRLAEVSKNTVATVLETQRYLIRRLNEKEEMNENEFYALIKQCRLQDHLMAAKEIEFLARTTNYPFLVEKRLWQKSELECAVKELDAAFTKNSRIHRVSDSHLNITAWPCHTKTLVSEPTVNLDEAGLDDYDDNDDITYLPGDDNTSGEENAEEELLLSGPSASSIDSSQFPPVPTAGVVTSYALTEIITPEPIEGGFYQVSPHRLREALKMVISHRQKHENWINLADQDEENCWKVRMKWKNDWYPLNHEDNGQKCFKIF